jgi:hypothetical protein
VLNGLTIPLHRNEVTLLLSSKSYLRPVSGSVSPLRFWIRTGSKKSLYNAGKMVVRYNCGVVSKAFLLCMLVA